MMSSICLYVRLFVRLSPVFFLMQLGFVFFLMHLAKRQPSTVSSVREKLLLVKCIVAAGAYSWRPSTLHTLAFLVYSVLIKRGL